MIKKERIFELKIEEDDELSGIDSISLVSEPAIEINWLAFNRECKDGCGLSHDFSSDDHKYVEHLMTNAETEDDLFNDGWVVDSFETVTGKENFVSTEPNAPSFEDTKEYRVRYKYVLNPLIKGDAIIPTSRDFCKELIRQNKVFRVEDIENATNDYGQSPLVYRNSWNCRHVWQRIKYRKDADIVNKASVNKGKVEIGGFPNDLIDPDYRVLGYEQENTATKKTKGNPSPSTVRNLGGMLNQGRLLNLSKDEFIGRKISIDFDDTLSTQRGQRLAQDILREKNDLYVVTRRRSFESAGVYAVTDKLGIPRNKVIFTNGKLKWETLRRLGITKHIDNNPDEIAAIKKNAPLIEAIQFDYDVSNLPAYKDELPTGKTQSFESYSDYPDSVKNNAQAVLKYVEENGWDDCGTDVGKQRANQLAKGEPISEETIRRMYSYLSRHEVDLQSSTGYGDGCGKLMYDSWGGKSALSWAESKIKSIETEKFEVGVPHYTADGKLYEGPTHKDASGKLMTGEVHTADSVFLYHQDEIPVDKVTCENCGWEWYIEDGDNEPYMCHKCGYDNSPQSMSKQKFAATDEEKRIVIGPAMLPNQKIIRKDKITGEPYYVFFSPDTIKMIADKYMKNQYTRNNDTEHDGKAVQDIYVTESWIVEDEKYDKSRKYGFEVPIGSWMVAMKIPKTPNGEKVWQKIKAGELNGFSVSGYFEEVAKFNKEEMFLFKLEEILKQTGNN